MLHRCEPGGMAGHNRREDAAGVRCRGWQGVVIPTAQASAAGAVVLRTAVFLGKNPSFGSVFPEGALGSVKLKTHFRVEVGFGCVR